MTNDNLSKSKHNSMLSKEQIQAETPLELIECVDHFTREIHFDWQVKVEPVTITSIGYIIAEYECLGIPMLVMLTEITGAPWEQVYEGRVIYIIKQAIIRREILEVKTNVVVAPVTIVEQDKGE